MNRLILITNKQKLLICIAAILFVFIAAVFVTTLNFQKVVETSLSDTETKLAIEEENRKLKDLLSTIVPASNEILFESNNRAVGKKYISDKETSILASEVISKGKNLEYIEVYSDENYLRPIYSTSWKQAYFRGWLYLPRKIIYSRHNLFTYEGDAGNIFDIEGELGFDPNISIDNHNYINFLIYNFDLQNVTQLENQIVIYGTPMKKGVQIISIKSDDVSLITKDSDSVSVKLCTPSGYEIDYQNLKLTATPNKEEEYGPVDETFFESENSELDISTENKLLKQQLTHFISGSSEEIYFQQNGSYQTSNVLYSNIDIDEAVQLSSAIKYNMTFNDKEYILPIYHPQWKEHYDREWCYIPRKMYLNMKKIFVIPTNKELANDLYGELGFFDKCPEIKENQVGIFVNNFSVQSVRIYEDNVLVSGVPSRTGVQIITVGKENLTKHKEYAVRLITKDLCEFDVDVIKN